MAGVESNSSRTPSDRTARDVARLDACWPCVRVESVQVTPGPDVECARAVVQLGGLAPADVRVELKPAGSGVAGRGPAPDERRMFSSQALENGCFVFEARLPHRDGARPQDWLIHVHPREALEDLRVEYRFRSDS